MSKEVTKTEATEVQNDTDQVLRKALKANNGKLRKDVSDAAKAWENIKDRERKNLHDWKVIGDGLLGVWNRLEATKGKAPSRKEFGQAIEAAGLGDLAQQDRSAAIKLIEVWDDLPWEEITASSPRRVLQQYRAVEQAKVENQQTGNDDQQDDDTEDADFQDVNDDNDAPEPSNREPAQVSGSDPWWMKQANQIADLPDLVTEVDPYGLASAIKGCKPVEDKLTQDKRQRARERAEQILAFLDAYEEEEENEEAAA